MISKNYRKSIHKNMKNVLGKGWQNFVYCKRKRFTTFENIDFVNYFEKYKGVVKVSFSGCRWYRAEMSPEDFYYIQTDKVRKIIDEKGWFNDEN